MIFCQNEPHGCEWHKKNQQVIKITNKLKKYILRKVSDIDAVEDIIQMTFLKAIENIHKYEEKSAMETWIFGISKNLIKEYYRKKMLQSKREEVVNLDNIDDGGCIEKIIDQRRCTETMIKAIHKMRHDEIYILKCICYDDQDYADLSEEMKVPIGTLKSKVFRIRNKLRKSCNYSM